MDSSEKDGAGMGCAEALELVLDSELLESAELAPGRRSALAAHLRTCANCAAHSKGLERALAALRAGGAAESVPADSALDLWPGLRATLAAEGRFASPVETRAAPTLQRARWRWTRVASFASAAAVLAIALPLLWKQGVGPAGSPPSIPPSPTTTPPGALQNQGSSVASSSSTSPGDLSADAIAAASSAVDASASSSLPAADNSLPGNGKGGLRRALGEERRRDFAVPFEASGESGAWSLASDRELR